MATKEKRTRARGVSKRASERPITEGLAKIRKRTKYRASEPSAETFIAGIQALRVPPNVKREVLLQESERLGDEQAKVRQAAREVCPGDMPLTREETDREIAAEDKARDEMAAGIGGHLVLASELLAEKMAEALDRTPDTESLQALAYASLEIWRARWALGVLPEYVSYTGRNDPESDDTSKAVAS